MVAKLEEHFEKGQNRERERELERDRKKDFLSVCLSLCNWSAYKYDYQVVFTSRNTQMKRYVYFHE